MVVAGCSATTDHTEDTDKDRGAQPAGISALTEQQARSVPRSHFRRPEGGSDKIA